MRNEQPITTKGGLLYQGKRLIDLPEADIIAQERGFMCAERLVKHLEVEQAKALQICKYWFVKNDAIWKEQQMKKETTGFMNHAKAYDLSEFPRVKHTLAPWAITSTKPLIVSGSDKRKTVVAHVQWPSDSRLIAACPDMLAALEGAEKALVKALPFCPPDNEAHYVGECLIDVRSALQKARGET